MADPDTRTPVLRDFTCKQIFHVLITGGGFFDVLVPIPLTSATGSALPLLLTALALIGLSLALHPAARRTLCACLPARTRRAHVFARTAAARTAEMALAVEAVRGACDAGEGAGGAERGGVSGKAGECGSTPDGPGRGNAQWRAAVEGWY